MIRAITQTLPAWVAHPELKPCGELGDLEFGPLVKDLVQHLATVHARDPHAMLVASMPRLPPMIAMPWTSSCRCCNKRQRCGYGYRVWQSLVAPARAALDAPLRRAMSGEANAQNELLLQHSTAKPICERCDKDHDLPATNECPTQLPQETQHAHTLCKRVNKTASCKLTVWANMAVDARPVRQHGCLRQHRETVTLRSF